MFANSLRVFVGLAQRRPVFAWLHRNSYLMPPDRWPSDHVRTVVQGVTTEDHRALVQALSPDPLQACLEKLLERRPGQVMTHLEWVR